MNLLIRTLLMFIISARRPKTGFLDICSTPLRVHPIDIDLFRHMNNGVYLSIAGLGRMDYTIRNGIADTLKKNNWIYVVVAQSFQYKKALKPFQKFEVTTEPIGWDHHTVVFEQKFISGEDVYAFGWVRTAVLEKNGTLVPFQEVLDALGVSELRRPIPDDVEIWTHSLDLHRQKASRL